jgi:molecular chaperone GrpE (heat shock protein)
MNLLRRLLRVRRSGTPAGPPSWLVELLANRAPLEAELAALRVRAAAGDARTRERLAELAERLEAASAALREALGVAPRDPKADLACRLDGLRDELGKLGREQFRATTLLEGQSVALEELGQALSELEERVRVERVKDLLPVADALDASLDSARALLAEPPARPAAGASWLARLLGAPARPSDGAIPERGEALEAWLEGLLLVQGRLLALLEREGVRPIAALGQPFDPHRHLAVGVSRAHGTPDGTVVREERRGYTWGERVLRHAEVVVARPGDDETSPGPVGGRSEAR